MNCGGDSLEHKYSKSNLHIPDPAYDLEKRYYDMGSQKKTSNKMRRIVLLMGLVLCILTGRLIYLELTEQKTEPEKQEVVLANSGELQVFINLENEAAGGTIQDTEKSTNSSLPSYTNLYPNLYAEPLVIKELKEDGPKTAYLSFDDGPSHRTCEILDILAKEDIKATFFIVGETITEEGKECLKQMAQQGHTLGLHTYSHNYKKLYSSVEAFLEDYDKLYQMIYEITGIKPNIFRFPGGSTNTFAKNIKKEVILEMERRGFTFYDWNVSAEDSVGKPTAYSIMKNIRKDYSRFHYPVLLMHDSEMNSLIVSLLPQIITELKDSGYIFDTLDNRAPCQFSWK